MVCKVGGRLCDLTKVRKSRQPSDEQHDPVYRKDPRTPGEPGKESGNETERSDIPWIPTPDLQDTGEYESSNQVQEESS